MTEYSEHRVAGKVIYIPADTVPDRPFGLRSTGQPSRPAEPEPPPAKEAERP